MPQASPSTSGNLQAHDSRPQAGPGPERCHRDAERGRPRRWSGSASDGRLRKPDRLKSVPQISVAKPGPVELHRIVFLKRSGHSQIPESGKCATTAARQSRIAIGSALKEWRFTLPLASRATVSLRDSPSASKGIGEIAARQPCERNLSRTPELPQAADHRVQALAGRQAGSSPRGAVQSDLRRRARGRGPSHFRRCAKAPEGICAGGVGACRYRSGRGTPRSSAGRQNREIPAIDRREGRRTGRAAIGRHSCVLAAAVAPSRKKNGCSKRASSNRFGNPIRT